MNPYTKTKNVYCKIKLRFRHSSWLRGPQAQLWQDFEGVKDGVVGEFWIQMGVELLIGQEWGNRSLVKQGLVLALL